LPQTIVPDLNNTRRVAKRSKNINLEAEFGSSLHEGSTVLPTPACTNTQRAAKRKASTATYNSKKVKERDATAVNSDVVFVSDVTSKQLKFDPLCSDVAQALCTQLNVESEKAASLSPNVGALGAPCFNEKIVGDGNCFFRAVSHAVCGTQKYHRKIRLAVVKQMQSNAVDYEGILRCEYSSIAQYLSVSKMHLLASWATEMEIQATADYLGVSIFTYHNDRWLEYSCKGRWLSNQAVYLEHLNGNHYETVICVQQPGMQKCYDYCKVNTSCSGSYNIRKKSSVSLDSPNPVAHTVGFTFNPLCTEVAQTLCRKCNVDFQKQHEQGPTVSGPLGIVCKTQKVKEDGNSFFSAISEVISGSQKSHRRIRLAAVKFMENHSNDHMKLVGKGYSSISEYINKTRMGYVGNCATNVEIQATANVLGVDIYTYSNGRWNKCSTSKMLSNEGIYLKHCENNIFEPVVCVQHVDREICFDLCKVGNSFETMPRRSVDKCTVKGSENAQSDATICSPPPRQCISKYYKRRNMNEMKMHYKNNLIYQKTVRDASVKKYTDLDYQEKVKLGLKLRYCNDADYKHKVIGSSLLRYHGNNCNPQRKKDFDQNKYKCNVLHKKTVKEKSVTKYREHVLHRQKLKQNSSKKYRENVLHRQKQKQNSSKKYRENVLHRQKLKQNSSKKYRENVLHREKVKAFSRMKYQQDLLHRCNVKAMSKRKYENPEYKKCVNADKKCKRQERKEKCVQFDFVMEQFLAKVKNGPDFVCCVCNRLLFGHQVLCCKKEDYAKRKDMALVAEKCITENYLHRCNDDCEVPCKWLDMGRGQLWICHTCHFKIKRRVMPPECVLNNMAVHPIPPELACLNSLEQHLIALHIPFMKMLALPKGGQNGVHGPVTCVPANIVQTSNLLPRSEMEGSLLRVKLKRKLTYKGHYEYKFVDTLHIRQALQYLKNNNVHYKDIEFNEGWLNEFCLEQDDDVVENETDLQSNPTSSETAEDEQLHDRQQHCMYQDTCLMPVDIGQEVLDQYFDSTLNLAPAEGNTPVRLLSDVSNEAKSFPVLFPQGTSTYHDARQQRLTLARYLNLRLLNADGRFAQNVEYIFYAQYLSEVQKVVSSVSIALRKGKAGLQAEKVDDELLTDGESLKKVLHSDEGFRFLKPVRGTPSFWQGAQRDLLACLRQLGIPTWFCSFSSADLRWTNLLNSVLKQDGRTQTVEDLEWADRCELLRRNPVTAARMFDFRWHCFLKTVLMSPSQPIGKIVDYFYRVEFQQRGSPHVHCLFWIENAPQIDKATDEEVNQFIDKFVTCELPSDDEPLRNIVTSVQQHSKRHSKTCKKNKTVCRFNFPRPASTRTFICRSSEEECARQGTTLADKAKREWAEKVMKSIKAALSGDTATVGNVEQLFHTLEIDQTLFEDAYKCIARNTHVVLRREIDEVWINQYNRPLLKCWNANMDIQYVVNAYACVVYIISYISKAEKEMGLLLGNAHREATKQGNANAKDALKKLGSVYLHNRDVCAQEAVYRLTNMRLKECSRKVQFVPTGENTVKISLPLSVLRQKANSKSLTTEDLWMTSLVDRYQNRPNDAVFNDMCLSVFASQYRVLSKSQRSKKSIELQNSFGFVQKRTRTQPAVVRYARFSRTKYPETFYHSILQLFLPYRAEVQLKPPTCHTFEEFYMKGRVRFNDGSRRSVKSVVDENRSFFEVDAEELDTVRQCIDDNGLLEDAWCELCPEQQLEQLECEQERKENATVDEGHVEGIPDLAVGHQQVAHLEKTYNMCRSDGLNLIRSLNDTQMSILYQIRQWCLDKISGNNPKPFHVFITGGAGTGKSHLIRALQYEATRLLSTLCERPDEISVLLTAPTGIAAYNLHASTIHTTLSIGIDTKLPYTPLGEEKINSLRAKYSNLQILIIDEISMVDHKLMAYIHGRLRQIKQSGDFSPFGNVSVIAVGDFFQLPPVKGKPLYVEDVVVNLWCNLFSVVELTTVVRQKNAVFAELLNRLRTHSKGTQLLASDLVLLKKCETGEENTSLHIFPTNAQVNCHNLDQLMKTCPDHLQIVAQDFGRNKTTGQLELKDGPHAKVYNTSLAQMLFLGVNARVMLIKNVDVMDGLVNGVCGRVTHIVISEGERFPKIVYVQFDDDEVGTQRRKQSGYALSNLPTSTPIVPEEDRVTASGGMRRQYPLKLAWACTIHKVQGVTVDRAVVSLKKIFAAGQAYVALSRVTSLSGLVIRDFNHKAIYCKDNIQQAIQCMPRFLRETRWQTVGTCNFTVFLMNVQSLTRHVADLMLCTQQLQLNCIAVTETWLPHTYSFDSVNLNGYTFDNCPRSSSYSSNNPTLVALKDQQHGGVGMYCADSLTCNILKVPDVNLECLVYNFVTYNMVIAVIYRPPSYPMSLFKENVGKLLDWLNPLSETIVVMGDFNDDILKSLTIYKLITDKGYVQLVTQPTTEKGTLIDHVYVKTTQYTVEAIVFPTYFSDHEGVLCRFELNEIVE